MSNNSLVQPLHEGALDMVGDVHGEIEALSSLMAHLGYDRDGAHPAGRRLVFLGDLTDRGPDSPGVIDLVSSLIDKGRAQCILGNHDLNILLERAKADNKWFFGQSFINKAGMAVNQKPASGDVQRRIINFFMAQPLVLERPGLRVVHACWRSEMVDAVRTSMEITELYDKYHDSIKADNKQRRDLDKIDKKLRHQNYNPVTLLTSGPEERVESGIWSGGKLRYKRRVEWWGNYLDKEICVFGHYAFSPRRLIGNGRAICIDYGVGKRWKERLTFGCNRSFRRKLAALRIPEMRLVFDDGREISLSIKL
jgi:hypothetical protein